MTSSRTTCCSPRSGRTSGPGDVRLTDFGIARIVGDGPKTTTGLLGTPEYMSPELLTTGGADLSCDVYGVGIMLYELLAGRTPFAGPGTDYTVAHRHVTSQPPGLSLPEQLATALDAMLDKSPSPARPPPKPPPPFAGWRPCWPTCPRWSRSSRRTTSPPRVVRPRWSGA